jgi:hypothetical protein
MSKVDQNVKTEKVHWQDIHVLGLKPRKCTHRGFKVVTNCITALERFFGSPLELALHQELQ